MANRPHMNDTPDFQAQAGEDISAGELVCIKSTDGYAYLADASDATLRPAVGVAETDTAIGEQVEIKGRGQCCGKTGLTPGAPQYLSATTPGALTETAPAYTQPVGFASCATEWVIHLVPDQMESWYGG